MIYTVTLNPSLDYSMYPKNIIFGKTNRSDREKICVGGKGINVSTVLNNLGIESVALGFVAGFVGKAITDELEKMGISRDFIQLDNGQSRINVKLKTELETEINANGPEISRECLDMLFEKLSQLCTDDILVLAGSIPQCLPNTVYSDILRMLQNNGVSTFVDASGELLLNCLQYKPFLVKPNIDELCEMFDCEIRTDEEILHYAKRLQEMGARNVIVSMGKNGSFSLFENGEFLRINGIKGTAINTVGAGDSMVAGFIAGFVKSGDYVYSAKLGAAASSASAFSEFLATEEDTEKYLKLL